MNKIKRNLGYSLISILVFLVLVFTVYGQRDIPVEKIKAKYGNAASKYMPLMACRCIIETKAIPPILVP